jgi:hypothetical protein
MAKRLIESVSGVGEVQAGHLTIRAARYDLSSWAHDEPGVAAATTGATVDGHIDITGIAEAAVLAGADTLTLTLADGRRIAFRLKSSGGAIAGHFL